jgi:hypothetical protein
MHRDVPIRMTYEGDWLPTLNDRARRATLIVEELILKLNLVARGGDLVRAPNVGLSAPQLRLRQLELGPQCVGVP